MIKKFCKCGQKIFVTSHFNGLTYVPVYRNKAGEELTHCPGCGDYLIVGELLNEPPIREDYDLVPDLLEALETHLREYETILGRGEWQAMRDASELRDYIHETFTLLAEEPKARAAVARARERSE